MMTGKRNHPKAIALAAVMLSVLASTAYAANNGKGGNDGRDGNRNNRGHNANELWLDRENGCAIGNRPPPGANCTNREAE